jgi:ankyrin repeat protein
METDLVSYLGLAFVLLLVGFALWLKIKKLFVGFRKLKTESDIRRLQNRSSLVRGLFRIYNWWKSIKQRRRNPNNFMEACRSGNLEQVKKLVEGGLDVNVRRHKGGRTGLMLAAQKNRVDVVKFLLDKGADPNIQGGGSGKTALIRAAERGNYDIFRALTDHGADLNFQARSNRKNALMKASEAGFVDVVKLLIEHGADVNLTDSSARTALSLALSPANRNAREILELLMGAGANVNIIDNMGASPLDRAHEHRLRDCEDLLTSHGAEFARYKPASEDHFVPEEAQKAYEILDCRVSDSDDHVRKQFHELAKKYHPDSIQGKDLPEDFVKFANERFVELHEAYKNVMVSRRSASRG